MMDDDNLAFEFVAGTLRGRERQHFSARLNSEHRLRLAVHFWEEHLMAMEPQLCPNVDKPAPLFSNVALVMLTLFGRSPP